MANAVQCTVDTDAIKYHVQATIARTTSSKNYSSQALTSTMNSSLILRHISRTKSAQGDIKYFAAYHY